MNEEIMNKEFTDALDGIIQELRPLTAKQRYVLGTMIKNGCDAAMSIEYLKEQQMTNALAGFDANGDAH